jgi:DNA-binding SARP family transcriptional activator
MPPRLEISLLGRFQITADGRELSGAFTPRVQSLLAYLTLHGVTPQSRQRLAYLLWPDTSGPQSRTNLRKSIHFLRQVLPCPDVFLIENESGLLWNPSAPFSLDVASFEEAAASGSCEKAIALYNGDLLPDCYDEWIVIDRERLRQIYLEALERLIQQKEDARAFTEALSFAGRLLQCDPLREEIHRHLIRLHAMNGDRAAALRAYQDCANLLQRELGVDPSPATRQVYKRLLDPVENPKKLLPLAGSFPLIGRTAEWSRLLEAWLTAAEGKPQLALIKGDAGIGKTRLAEELLVWVDRQGISTASAQCYAVEGVLAYAPVTTWLREFPMSDLDPGWQTEVCRILPELLQQNKGLNPPGPLIETWQRQRFHEALARAILGPGLAMTHPLLLLIEDLQWCDCDMLEWLHYLLRFNSRARMLVLGTLRDDALQKDCLLSTLMMDLRKQKLLTEIELKPLSKEETALLGKQTVGHALEAEVVDKLYDETEGNPLFVVEYSRAGLGRPSDVRDAGSPGMLPPGVQAAILARLAQLSISARNLMELAAVIGREFTYEVLRRASGEGESALVQALDELWQRRLIREKRKNSYDFTHDKLRQAAYQNISDPRRRFLHRRVAETLAGYASEAAYGQTGWHYIQAGENQPAAGWLLKAGEAAARVGAFAEALTHLDHALELVSETDQTGRFEILLAREKIFHIQADREAQAQSLDALEKLAGALNDASKRAQAAVARGSFLSETSDFPGAIAAAQAALNYVAHARSRVDDSPDQPPALALLEVEAYNIWGATLEFQGKHVAALAIHEKALELARRAGQRTQEARVLIGLARCTEDISTGIAYLEAALAIYREVGDKPGECACLDALGYNLLWSGRYEKALDCYQTCLQIARQLGYRRGEANALFRLGHFFNQMGNYTRGLEYLCLSLDLANEEKDQRRVAYNLFNLSVSERGIGQAGTAKKHTLEALSICQAVGDRNGEIIAWNLSGTACAELGEWEQAILAYRSALDIVQGADDPGGVIYCMARLARALLGRGETAEAIRTVDEILRRRGNGVSLQGTDEGVIPVYMDCYQVLRANGDPRARELLEDAHALLEEQVSHINDEELRRSFLENKPEIIELVKAWGSEKDR